MSLRTIAAFGAPALILVAVFVKIHASSPTTSLATAPAPLEAPKACEVGQILASDGRATFDPALEHLQQRLLQPPLNVFSRFEFLASREFPCSLDQVEMPLHGGGVLSLALHDQHEDHREWFIVVQRPDGSTLMQTRAAVYADRPLLIVTANGDRKSVVIWVSTQV